MCSPFAVPGPLLESKSFEEKITRYHGLPHRETPRKRRAQLPDIRLADIQERTVHFTAAPPDSSAVLLTKMISPPNEAWLPSSLT